MPHFDLKADELFAVRNTHDMTILTHNTAPEIYMMVKTHFGYPLFECI